MRKTEFANGEFYHIFNRGTDGRNIFDEVYDLQRFFESMKDFNGEDRIGSMYEYSFIKKQLGSSTSKLKTQKPLVNFIAYCLNPNHFHFLLEQVEDGGIPKFMHRLSTGYTKYFNKKYKRTGSLFSGRYKAIHVDTNEYLLRLSAYVNLNNKVHHINNKKLDFPVYSSWNEYEQDDVKKAICKKDVIVGQFRSTKDYINFAQDALKQIHMNKKNDKELKGLLFE